MAIETIENKKPNIKTTVTIFTPFSNACPHSGEPQVGSLITVTYSPKDRLIGLRAIDEYLKELAKGKEAMDLETVVQMVYMECKQIGIDSIVRGMYKLRGGLEMVCECQS